MQSFKRIESFIREYIDYKTMNAINFTNAINI